jgi:hypothetical protein
MGQFTEGMEVFGCDVDGTTLGTTQLFVAANGFVVSQVQVVLVEVDSLTSAPTFTVGTNSPDYDNICGSTSLAALTEVNNVLNVSQSNPGYHIETGDEIYVNVTGSAVTMTYDFQVILIGYPL